MLLKDSIPPRHCLYKVPLTQKEELKRQIDEFLALGQIERAHSPIGAGVLFVEKHDKTLRLCVDCRRLNATTVKDVYPAPRVDDSIDKMANARFFANMDLRSGFYQIRVAPEDVHKTAFQTEWGSFQWLVMPFALTNAPSTFQRTMDMTFDDMHHFTAVYMGRYRRILRELGRAPAEPSNCPSTPPLEEILRQA